jgi:hypothetical protein
MPETISGERPSRPIQTDVRRVQPDPAGGRPIDVAVLRFDEAFQGLVSQRDDLAVLTTGMEMARRIQRRLRDLFEHLGERAESLRKIIPDQQKLVAEIDQQLCDRTAAR